MRPRCVLASLMVLASTATLVAQQPKPSAAAKPEAKAARGPAPRVFGTPLRMHQNFASCVAWSPDGKLAASGGWDGVVQLFDAASGKAVGRLEPGEVVQGVAFCGTGATKLVVKCMKQGLRVYDVATRREVGRLDGELGRIAVFPDGLTVAVGTRAGELWLVDGDTCAKRKAVAVCEGSIETVSVAPDGGMVACNELMSRTGHLYDVREEKVVKSVKWGSLATEQLFEPDGKAMLVISSRIVRRITVPGGEEVDSWQLGSTTMCATLSRDGTRIYLGDDEGAVVCIDREAGKVVAVKREHVDAVKDLELSPDGKVLLSASQDRTVRFWAASDLAEQYLAAAHNGLVRSVSLEADGATIVSASNDNSAVVWSRDGKLLHKSTAHDYAATHVAHAPDGSWWSSSMDGTVRHFDAKHAEVGKVQLEEDDAFVQSFTLDDAGKTLVTGHADGTVRWYDAATGAVQRKGSGHEGRVLAVCAAGDSSLVASAGEDGKLVVWDPATGTARHTLAAHEGGVSGLVRLPDGALVTTGWNREMKRWDRAAGTATATVTVGDADESAVGALAFIASRGQLVTASADALRLFSAADLVQVGMLPAPPAVPSCLAAAADGSLLVAGLVDSTLAAWTLPAAPKAPAKAPAKPQAKPKPGKQSP